MNGTRQAVTGKVAEDFPREPETARAARRLVESALDSWGLMALSDDADLVISELVANAVRHTAGAQITVSVDRVGERGVRLGVADGSRVMPYLRRPGLGELRGRGLPLVDALCGQWGTDRLHWGKRVWAELGVRDAR